MAVINVSQVSFEIFLILTIITLPSRSVWAEEALSCQEKLTNCTEMVNPYLRDVRYMFPTTANDVDDMCKVWSRFVDCVRRYVSSCFSDERRTKFNMAVENSVDTVHAICSSDSVQREYLSNAVCFRRVSVEYCSQFYTQLVHHVSSPKAFDDHICCSYSQFRKCVHDPLLRECGQRARNLLDHSLSFLASRCDKSVSLSERCPSLPITPTPLSFPQSPDSSFPRQRFRSHIPTEVATGTDTSTVPEGSFDSLHEHLRDEAESLTAQMSNGGDGVNPFITRQASVTLIPLTVVLYIRLISKQSI